MAITVAHEPSAGLIANSAYQGGLGGWQRFMLQYQLQQQNQALQQQQLASQNAYHNAALNQSAYGQNLDFIQAANAQRVHQQALQQQLNQQGIQNDFERQRLGQGQQHIELGNRQQDNIVADRAADNARQEAQNKAQQENIGKAAVVADIGKWNNDQIEVAQGMRNRGMKLKDEVIEDLSNYDQQLRKIVTNKDGSMNPSEMAMAAGDVRRKMADLISISQVPDPGATPFAQQLPGLIAETPYGVVSRDQNGKVYKVADPPKSSALPYDEWEKANYKNFVGEDGGQPSQETLRKGYANHLANAEYFDRMKSDKEFAKAENERISKERQQQQQEMAQQQAAESAHSQEALRQFAQQNPQAAAQFGIHYGQPPRVTAPQAAPVTPVAAPGAKGNTFPRRLAEHLSGSASKSSKAGGPVSISDLDSETKDLAQKHLPHPKTEKEWADLPAGTTFVAPNGRLKVK